MTERVCVTGGAGMIGSRLVRALCRYGYRVTVVDNLWRGRREYLADIAGFDVQRDFHELDLADPRSGTPLVGVLKGCDAVVHLADIVAGIAYVFDHQYDVFRINNLINTNVFFAAAQARVPRILYAGTACSFPKHLQSGLQASLAEEQLFPAEPESAYGWSKLLGSLELQFMAERFQIEASTLILHNVYGPNCDVDLRRAQVIPSLMRRMLELPDGGTLVVWGSGGQGRAFVFVDDVCDAMVAALGRRGLPHFIQIGPDSCTSIRELVEILRDRIVCRPMAFEFDTTRPEGDRGRCADYSLARAVLNWSPKTGLVDGLAETFNWIKTQVGERACLAS